MRQTIQLLSKISTASSNAAEERRRLLESEEVVTYAAYPLSESFLLHTNNNNNNSSAPSEGLLKTLAAEGKTNVQGKVVALHEAINLEDSLRALLRNTQQPSSTEGETTPLPLTLFVDDSEALECLPVLYNAARDGKRVLLHQRRSYSPNVSSLFDLGCVVFFSDAPHTHSSTLLAHLISTRLARPVLHCFGNGLAALGTDKLPNELWEKIISEKNLSDERGKEKEKEGEEEGEGKQKEKEKNEEEKVGGFYLRTNATQAIVDEKGVLEEVGRIGALVSAATGQEFKPFDYVGPADAEIVFVVFAGGGVETDSVIEKVLDKKKAAVGLLRVRLYRPWHTAAFTAAVPSTVSLAVVLDFVDGAVTQEGGWGSLLLDVSSSLREDVRVVSGRVFSDRRDSSSGPWLTEKDVEPILDRLSTVGKEETTLEDFVVDKTTGKGTEPTTLVGGVMDASSLRRAPYFDVLKQLFGGRLHVVESDGSGVASGGTEFGYGVALSLLHKHASSSDKKPSVWLVGGKDLQHEKGLAAVHHVLSSGEKVNLLVIDDTPLSTLEGKADNEGETSRRKDLGLYAMNYGGAYVASVALYSSYVQLLQALMEADEYPGPSLVLAYAPSVGARNSGAALAMLKDTKVAVDNGSWPLYRWNPSFEKQGKEPFQLDSDKIKAHLQEFVDRGNQFSLLISQQNQPQSIVPSVTVDVAQRQQVIVTSFQKLVKALDAKPLLILYASDGGRAQDCARRLAAEGIRCGFNARYSALDDFVVTDLSQEPTVIFSVSTAGQGEFPTNGKEFWKALSEVSDASLFNNVNFAVLGLGDSHYWPGEDGLKYFCLPAVELDQKMEELGAIRILPAAKADDQHSDGHETVFSSWKKELWAALGVGLDPSTIEENVNKLPPDDVIKRESNYLRGTIAKSLADTSTGSVCDIDAKLLKFHGIYQQDDRDIRESRRKQNLEKAFIFMARVRLPGGVCTPSQWLLMDGLADSHANGTLKLTTRQTFQMHGILKKNLKAAIQEVNKALMDTIAACGDVNRNVMCNPNPYQSQLHGSVYDFAKRLSAHLTPHTSAYHEIWLDKQVVSGNAVVDVEPIYGPTYLPRKFKIAVAVPPSNDVDVFANDLGFIAIADEQGSLVGFNVTIGGGMGMTFNNKTADLLGFCKVEDAINVGEKILLVQRDHGDRSNRKHARLKYTIDDNGLAWFKGEVEARLGYKLEEPRSFHFTSNGDRYGWTAGLDGKSHFCVFVENGRVADRSSLRLRSALREIAQVHKGDFRLTPNQNLIIANIPAEEKVTISEILARYGLSDSSRHSGLRLNSMACVALPTCGLAFAESERYLPELVTRLEEALNEAGLRHDAITIRMSGCPNGCSRPYVAEIALVGRAPGFYNVYLGGGFYGQRLGKLYKESVDEDAIVKALAPLFKSYAQERLEGEHFGDFCIRTNVVKETTHGKNFHD